MPELGATLTTGEETPVIGAAATRGSVYPIVNEVVLVELFHAMLLIEMPEGVFWFGGIVLFIKGLYSPLEVSVPSENVNLLTPHKSPISP